MMHWNLAKRIVLLLLVVLVQFGCASITQWDSQAYTVKHHETLYAIAWRYRLDYRDVAKWNNIPAPYTIYPGQKLIMEPGRRLKSSNKQTSGSQVATASKSGGFKSSKRKKSNPPPKKWQWPAAGQLVATFKGDQSASQGIDIQGQLGQSVKATANGKVVYSGNGLVGYGNLVIVKHNDTYLSAYAHNNKLLVKEGDKVKIGMTIAEMGYAEANKPLLHFEIRKHGKPVDPLKYLPKR